ncbi:hypothetical protein KSP40_PGU014469 [Platanthera guangdongensis]|uniref:Ubiquitin-like protease family profile domain-containing protein n=1 Tax=Platanthera guangdongensis TaxID=2320717 RepID=A0ABR2MF06_9ASPA
MRSMHFLKDSLIGHITPESVEASDLVLMPCHLGSHWALLVCWLKEQRWEYLDSLPSSLHHSGVRANLKALQEDALHAFPERFIDWPVEDARKSPQQSNNYDCGVFVIKYMKVVTSLEVVTWQDHQGWQADMPRFRAEIAAQICKTFARHIADKLAAF